MYEADLALIDREPALPGLALVLDPAQLRDHLGATTLTSGYVRWKPGTSAVADAWIDGQPAQVIAYPLGVHDKLARTAARAQRHTDLIYADRLRGLAVVGAASDRDLPGIRRALQRHPQAEPIVYKPARRWVARCTECEVFIKAHTPARMRRALAGHQMIAPLLPSAPVVWRHRTGVVETVLLSGAQLAAANEAQLRACGALLAELHRQPPPPGAEQVRSAALRSAVNAVGTLLPELRRRAAGVGQEVARLLAGRVGTAPIHGDFSADQVLVDADQIRIIDWDRAGIGDPMADLGSWTADELADGVPRARAGTALVAGYSGAGGVVDEAALFAQTAAQLLSRATEPFRSRHRDWATRVAELLCEAEQLVALARVRSDRALPGAAAATPDSTVIAHRLGRRAVLRTPDGYLKLTRRSRIGPLAARAERARQLTVLRSPTVLLRDDRRASLLLTPVGTTTLLAGGPALSEAAFEAVWQRVGRGITELHQLDPAGLEIHDLVAEQTAIAKALERAVASGTLDPGQVAAAYDRVTRQLAADTGPVGVLHRDLHDKQVLLSHPAPRACQVVSGEATIGLIDSDTMAVGERALDVANLLMHLQLRVRQGVLTAQRARLATAAFRAGIGESPLWDRVPAFAAATQLRLAGVYATRTSWPGLAQKLLDELAEDH